MRRLLLSLSIIALILGLTSCSNGKESAKQTTTTHAPLAVFLRQNCPEGAGFCIDFPTLTGESKATKLHYSAEGTDPANDSYFTEVYPGEETEQYAVKVYNDDAEGKTIKALLANYANKWWKCTQSNEMALMTCTWRSNNQAASSVTTEMLVAGTNKLYVVQASTMSKNDPTYVDQFMNSFAFNT